MDLAVHMLSTIMVNSRRHTMPVFIHREINGFRKKESVRVTEQPICVMVKIKFFVVLCNVYLLNPVWDSFFIRSRKRETSLSSIDS